MLLFSSFSLSLSLSSVLIICTLSDYRMMMMFAIFRYDEMMEKSEGLKQFTRGDL